MAGWDHLPRLDLTARVVREALRLYPPAWVLPRVCTRPVTLAGRTLPPGTMVVFSPYILHRRPDLYPHPARFDPARWLTPAPDHRASYLPFSAGATRCIGEEFGLAESTLILATTAARWNPVSRPRHPNLPGHQGRPGTPSIPRSPIGPLKSRRQASGRVLVVAGPGDPRSDLDEQVAARLARQAIWTERVRPSSGASSTKASRTGHRRARDRPFQPVPTL